MTSSTTASTAKIETDERAESRWPALAAILVVLALYALLPSTFPLWVRLVIVFAAIVLERREDPFSAEGQGALGGAAELPGASRR